MSHQKPQPPRPHSADFLDYEAKCKPNQQTNSQSGMIVNQQKRPKSSLDIMNPSDMSSNDNYFYSEER